MARNELWLCVTLLLAGCGAPDSTLQIAPEPDTIVEQPASFYAVASLWMCVENVCGGAKGPSSQSFGGATFVGFRFEVRPSDDPLGLGVPYPPSVPGVQVRIVVECAGEARTCPAGVLAETEGPWPATLEASGFRIEDPNRLRFRVEYRGPYPEPINGSGEVFEFEGTFLVAEGAQLNQREG